LNASLKAGNVAAVSDLAPPVNALSMECPSCKAELGVIASRIRDRPRRYTPRESTLRRLWI